MILFEIFNHENNNKIDVGVFVYNNFWKGKINTLLKTNPVNLFRNTTIRLVDFFFWSLAIKFFENKYEWMDRWNFAAHVKQVDLMFMLR